LKVKKENHLASTRYKLAHRKAPFDYAQGKAQPAYEYFSVTEPVEVTVSKSLSKSPIQKAVEVTKTKM
jgi:hypothetical protein